MERHTTVRNAKAGDHVSYVGMRVRLSSIDAA